MPEGGDSCPQHWKEGAKDDGSQVPYRLTASSEKGDVIVNRTVQGRESWMTAMERHAGHGLQRAVSGRLYPAGAVPLSAVCGTKE